MKWWVLPKELKEFRKKESISQRILSCVHKEWWQARHHPREKANRKLAQCPAHEFATQLLPSLKQKSTSSEYAFTLYQKHTRPLRGFLRVLFFLSILLPTILLTTWIYDAVFLPNPPPGPLRYTVVPQQLSRNVAYLRRDMARRKNDGISHITPTEESLKDTPGPLGYIFKYSRHGIFFPTEHMAAYALKIVCIVSVVMVLIFRNVLTMLAMSFIYGAIFAYLFIAYL